MTKLTDHEINVAVAKLQGSYISPESHLNNYREHVPDYVNNWGLAGPIMEENHIDLEWQGGYWNAYLCEIDRYFRGQDENPLRAILIVYLNIKGVL